jgi:hypothetical protein
MKMKKILCLITITLLLLRCESDAVSANTQTNVSLNFVHAWEDTPVTNSDFNSIQFTNENGEQLSIERLRYLISNVTFTTANNENLVFNGYNLIDVTNNQNLSFTPTGAIPLGTYNNVSFIFGFNNEDNYIEGGYPDLNSASFNVPGMLGGGYHYMQFDGKFINTTNEAQGFNYHAIRAVDNIGENPTFPKDTFFKVNLGAVTITANTVLTIEMNIAEWFKTPNRWNLNELNQMLMPNADAQIMMFENGQNVFSLKSVNE